MMTIGEFAQASGLTITALRFYDEKGLLEPRAVDPGNGYRQYSGGQVRRAVLIKLLREMGMPLSAVAEIVDDPDRAGELLSRFRRNLEAERARQDAAIASGLDTLAAFDRPSAVQTREAAEQHWVGAVVTVTLPMADPESGAEQYNAVFARLVQALSDQGNPPVGSFWTTIRSGDTATSGELVLCWPVQAPIGPDFAVPGLRLERGTLPARTEAYVRLMFDSADYPQGLSDAAPHPAFLDLLERIEESGVEPAVIRQVGLPGVDGLPIGIDIAVTLTPP